MSLTIVAIIFAPLTEDHADVGQHVLVGGQHVTEYQCRLAHQAGAQLVVLCVERISKAMLVSVDRLTDEGVKIAVVRDASELREQIHPEEQVLLIAASIVAEPRLVRELVADQKPMVLGVRNMPDAERFERIDGFTSWSGLAILPGELVRQTAQQIGDWDLQSTLLRSALQHHLPVELIDLEHGDAPLIGQICEPMQATRFNKALLQRIPTAANGAIDSFIWCPLTDILMPTLLRWTRDATWFAAALGLLVLLTLASNWLAPIIIPPLLFLLGGFIARIAVRLSSLSLRETGRLQWLLQARIAVGGISLMMMAKRLVDYGIGWGFAILSLWVLVEIARLSRFDPWFLGKRGLPVWRSGPDVAAVIIVIAHLYNVDILGLELVIVSALATDVYLRTRLKS